MVEVAQNANYTALIIGSRSQDHIEAVREKRTAALELLYWIEYLDHIIFITQKNSKVLHGIFISSLLFIITIYYLCVCIYIYIYFFFKESFVIS